MPKKNAKPSTTVGVAERGNSAELVTIGPGAELLDRRRVELTHDLPVMLYHHEGRGRWAAIATACATSIKSDPTGSAHLNQDRLASASSETAG